MAKKRKQATDSMPRRPGYKRVAKKRKAGKVAAAHVARSDKKLARASKPHWEERWAVRGWAQDGLADKVYLHDRKPAQYTNLPIFNGHPRWRVRGCYGVIDHRTYAKTWPRKPVKPGECVCIRRFKA